jgi:hypothetical protein
MSIVSAKVGKLELDVSPHRDTDNNHVGLYKGVTPTFLAPNKTPTKSRVFSKLSR